MRNAAALFLMFLILIFTRAFGQGSVADAYKDGLNTAQSNMQKAVNSINNLNPSETFKDQNGKSFYTDNPPQISHYQSVEHGDPNVLDTAGRAAIDKNEAAKETWKSFGNPKIKLDSNEPWLNKSSDIVKNASAIVTGVSSSGVDCTKQKICHTVYTKHTCNEQVRNLHKTCDKIPKIKSLLKTIAYPNCKSVVVAQTYRGGCPKGYSQIVYSDMIRWVDWDDISICVKTVDDVEGQECYAGHLVYGISGEHRSVQSTGRVTVPKNAHARLKFSNVYHNQMKVKLVNETTGQMIYDSGVFTSGQVVELPFSETKDQSFAFSQPPQKHPRDFPGTGVMLVVLDHIRKEKDAVLESWEENNCVEN